MCQLTMVDMKAKEFLPGNTLRWLLSMNSKEGHLDGIGCYLWDKDFLLKSKEEASPWLRANFATKIYPQGINGIFHVRRASVKTTKTEIKDYHAHPFEEGDLVLAHNGTLTPNGGITNKVVSDAFFDLDKEDVIDSQKFLRILNIIKGDKDLTPDIIKETMTYFWGSFAMIIYSKKEKKTFVLRDTEKTLHYANFTVDDIPVGLILNTKYYMLDAITEILCDVLKKPVLMSLGEVEKDSIFEYIPGSFKLEKVGTITQSARSYVVVTTAAGGVNRTVGQQILPGLSHYNLSVTDNVQKILSISKRLRLNLYDLFLLYELFFDSTILSADRDDLISFTQILSSLEKQSTDTRIEKIDSIAKLFPENYGIDFFLPFEKMCGILNNYPPVLNGKVDLSKAIEKLESTKKGLILQ